MFSSWVQPRKPGATIGNISLLTTIRPEVAAGFVENADDNRDQSGRLAGKTNRAPPREDALVVR